MSMLDPRQFLLPAFYLDPTTNSLIGKPPTQTGTGGKMGISHSFRISDLLESPTDREDRANTSGENESDSTRPDSSASSSAQRSPSTHSHSPSGSKKARKARTIFTDKQLQELEATFESQKYLSVQDRMDLAQRMGLSDTQVKTWYQNRRTKWKRQANVGVDLLHEAGNLAAVQNLLRTNPYWAGYLNQMPSLALGLMPSISFPMMMPGAVPGQISGFSGLQMNFPKMETSTGITFPFSLVSPVQKSENKEEEKVENDIKSEQS